MEEKGVLVYLVFFYRLFFLVRVYFMGSCFFIVLYRFIGFVGGYLGYFMVFLSLRVKRDSVFMEVGSLIEEEEEGSNRVNLRE